MISLRIIIFSMIIAGSVIIFASLLTVKNEDTSIEDYQFGCTPDFWKNNLDLWKVVGVDYNDDFDETFGTNYFEPNITLKQAISAQGSGWHRLASYGTAAYLDSLVNPYADPEILKEQVRENKLHPLETFVTLCEENT